MQSKLGNVPRTPLFCMATMVAATLLIGCDGELGSSATTPPADPRTTAREALHISVQLAGDLVSPAHQHSLAPNLPNPSPLAPQGPAATINVRNVSGRPIAQAIISVHATGGLHDFQTLVLGNMAPGDSMSKAVSFHTRNVSSTNDMVHIRAEASSVTFADDVAAAPGAKRDAATSQAGNDVQHTDVTVDPHPSIADLPPAPAFDAAAAEIEVIAAHYGAAEQFADVLEHVREPIKHRHSVFVRNQRLGGDPAPGVAKHLHMRLKIDGKEYGVIVSENSIWPAMAEPPSR